MIKDWWTFRSLTKDLKKEVDQNINVWYNSDRVEDSLHEHEVQKKYYNGLTLMKARLKDKAANSPVEEILTQYKGSEDFYTQEDLLALAKDSTEFAEELTKLRASIVIYEGSDIKSDEDKEKMINDRINHYLDLQKHKLERELLRKARQAYKQGNLELHNSLMNEWSKKYGKSRNSKAGHQSL
jgi:hypothetical protein